MSTNRASGQAATATASQKAWTFDVASIKKQTAGGQPMMVMPKFGPTADGYRSSKLPLSLVLITAYVPQTGGAASYGQSQIAGLPDWMKTQPYDADARIAADDRAEWQKPDKQPEMLRPMLQALLAERLMLQIHRESKESALYTLVVGKGGPKFEETKPDVAEPWFQISRMAR